MFKDVKYTLLYKPLYHSNIWPAHNRAWRETLLNYSVGESYSYYFDVFMSGVLTELRLYIIQSHLSITAD